MLLFGLVTAFAWVITTAISLSANTSGDYTIHGTGADNAGPAVAALLHGNFGAYVAHQPAIGLTSLVLRIPAAWAGSLTGGSGLVEYRLGAAACLLPLGLLAAWLIAYRQRSSVGWLPGLAAAALLLLSPAVQAAVQYGHPEDVLAGVLATGAVIAATRGHGRWAAVMLGLAIGTKPWAVIAVAPVLVAFPGRRVEAMVISGGLAALLTLPAPLADPVAFVRSIHGEGATHLVGAASFWWPVSSPLHLPSGAISQAAWLPFDLTRSGASLTGLVVVLGVLGLGWRWVRHRGHACDALALLALVGVLRCAIDPTHLEYYYLAALIPLVAWEVVGLGRPPIIAGVTSIAVALIPIAELHEPPAVLSAASIAGTVMLGCYLATAAFKPIARYRRAPRSTLMFQPSASLTSTSEGSCSPQA